MKEKLQEYLINYLLNERGIENNFENTFSTLRALLNTREPKEVSDDFLDVESKYLKLILLEKGIVDYKNFKIKEHIYLVKCDITTINTHCIVNAANKYLLGCFIPNHKCIDNAIHTYSGVQLRNECNSIMAKQSHLEENGFAKITDSYNLICKKIIHTVGPIVYDDVTKQNIIDLRNCYKNILQLAVNNNMKSIAICCISTGEFCFPNDLACKIAIQEVEKFLESNIIDVVFNVFKEIDYELYRKNISI